MSDRDDELEATLRAAITRAAEPIASERAYRAFKLFVEGLEEIDFPPGEMRDLLGLFVTKIRWRLREWESKDA